MNSFQKSKLIELLFALNKRQRKDLKYFILIPSLNLRDYEIEVCSVLLELLEKKKLKHTSQKEIIKLIKGAEDKIEENWKYVTSNLLKVIYQYMSHTLSTPGAVPDDYKLLQYFYNENLKKNYVALSNKLFKNVNSGKASSSTHYHKYLLLELKAEDPSRNLNELEKLSAYEDELDRFYVENKIRIFCEKENRKKIVNSPANNIDIEKWKKQYKPESYNSSIAQIFYNIYKMLNSVSENEVYYEEVKKLFNSIGHEGFSHKDTKIIYDYLMNFCISMLNNGKIEYAKEFIKHVKFLESQKLLLDKGVITVKKYKNIAMAGLIIEEYNWVESFVWRYKKKLGLKNYSNILNLNLANIEFHQKKYDKALEYLEAYQPYDFYFKLSYEKLLLKIYYEKGDYQAIRSRIPSFEAYIKNKNTISFKNRELLQNFLSCLKLMIDKDSISLNMIIESVAITDYLWFRKKLGGNK